MTVIGWVGGGGILLLAGPSLWILVAGLMASAIVLFLALARRAYGAAWEMRWPLLKLAALSCLTAIACLGMPSGLLVLIGDNLCFEGGCPTDWTGALITGCSLLILTVTVIALRRVMESMRMRTRRLGLGS